jgi:hypothetical protein
MASAAKAAIVAEEFSSLSSLLMVDSCAVGSLSPVAARELASSKVVDCM